MTDDPYEIIRERLHNVRGSGARCPGHDDRANSLAFKRGDNQPVVMHCHAGCTIEMIMEALNLPMSILSDTTPRLVQLYDYTDEEGNLLWQIARWANPKTFRAINEPPAEQRVLYQMPRIKFARDNGLPIYVVEGEKDADRLIAEGYIATTNVGGAGREKWLDHYSESLKGLDVFVVADDDDAGRRHAQDVRRSLEGLARRVTLLKPRKGFNDISDHFDAGCKIGDLEPLPLTVLGIEVVRMSDVVTDHATPWAWLGRIPMGNITMFDGDPGDGKSTLACKIVAHMTTGIPWPDDAPAASPSAVIMFSAEDDLSTVAKRLEAAGADRAMVFSGPQVNTVNGPRPFDLGEKGDLASLEDLIRDTGAKMIIFDPLMAFLSDKTDSYKDSSVRKALMPLAMLAMEYGVAIVVIRHLTKGGSKALYRGGGSIAFIGAARAGYLVAPDPEDDQVRVIACIKNNLAPKPPALKYRLSPSVTSDVSVVRWAGTSDLSAQALLDAQAEAASREPRQEVRDFLVELLSAPESRKSTWKQILASAREAGMDTSEHTLRRARNDLGLVKETEGKFLSTDRKTLWMLPQFAHLPTFEVEGKQGTDWAKSKQMGKEGNVTYLPTRTEDAHPETTLPSTSEVGKQGKLACDVCGVTDGVSSYEAGLPILNNTSGLTRCGTHNPYEYEADEDA